MCGIAGFFCADKPLPNGPDALRRLKEAIHHRGPDDNGEFLSANGCAGLTATRLSILDLSPAGHQPMRTADGRYTIVFNGEIYNFEELRGELAAAGVEFRSHGDTEVILQLYLRYGSTCVKRLSGMFAFAIWDEREQAGFLARDPLGIKLLYLYQKPGAGVFAFASELRPLLSSGLVPRQLNARVLADYFRTGTPPEPDTLIENVRLLEAGSHLWWRGGKVKTQRFWDLPLGLGAQPPAGPAGAMSETDAVRITRAALDESLERHFVSDVPVGLFLSGGIDSTALLALAQARGHRNLRTFSIGVDHAGFDESSLARRTAMHFNTRHEEWQLDGKTSRALFSEFLAHTDQPSIDGFNTFAISRLAHKSGMKVVLSGLGGDEIFGGYPIFKALPRILAASRRLGPARTAVGYLLEHFARRPAWRRLGDFLGHSPNLLTAYLAYRGVFTERESRALAAEYTGQSIGRPTPVVPADVAPGPLGDIISALEIERYMRNQLLRDSDVMSMANSLELRVPFVDSRLLETLARIPSALRLQNSKRLLLQAVPEVPEWIATQPKRGFSFPFEEWLETDWKECFDGRSQPRAVSAQTWYQKWAVFLFEHWWEQLT